MKITLDLTEVRFTEFLIAMAKADLLGSRCKEAILDIPRSELVKKSDYLYSVLDIPRSELVKKSDYLYSVLDTGETTTLDDIIEAIAYGNWGAPDYKEDGSEFWE